MKPARMTKRYNEFDEYSGEMAGFFPSKSHRKRIADPSTSAWGVGPTRDAIDSVQAMLPWQGRKYGLVEIRTFVIWTQISHQRIVGYVCNEEGTAGLGK